MVRWTSRIEEPKRQTAKLGAPLPEPAEGGRGPADKPRRVGCWRKDA